MKRLFYVAVLAILTAIASSDLHAEQPQTTSVKWQPALATGETLFPSLILATRNADLNKSPPEGYLGDPTGMLGVKIRSSSENTKIHLAVVIDGLSKKSTFDGILAKADQEYTIMPYIRYKSDALWKIKQPYPTTALFSVSINGAPAEEVTQRISVRTVNDVPLEIEENGKNKDVRPLFAAFVNENAPIIDKILQDALVHKAVNRFVGYDTDNQQEVYRQIFAIWNALQRRDIKYSSIVTPSGFSKDILSQHVRMVDESFEVSQANCADGSILLASIFYKIGLYPVLAIKPGHMFVGVYLNRESFENRQLQNIAFIETTEIGSITLDRFQKNWHFITEGGYINSVSYGSMLHAIETGRKEYNEMIPFVYAKQDGYEILDIHRIRSLGIMPISSANSLEQPKD